MIFSRDDVRILDREVLFQGFFRMVRLRLQHRLFAGGWSPEMQRELFERGHAAVLMPYDPKRDAIVVQEQFRVGAIETTANPWLLEMVAGIIEPGESAEQVVRREAVEEAGLAIGRIEPLFSYLVSPGGTTERIELFVGEVDSSEAGGLHGLADECEDIRVTVISRAEAIALLDAGQISNAAMLIALQWLARHGEALRQRWAAP